MYAASCASLPSSMMLDSTLFDQTLRRTLVFRYTIVSTACFVLYEHLINFDYEIRFLWQRRFSFGSCLLFLCRYFSIVQISIALFEYIITDDYTDSHCKALIRISASMVYLQYCLSNVVLYARTYAVWAGDKRVLVVLVGSYVLSAVGTCHTVYRFIRGISVLDPHPWSGCILLMTDRSIFYGLIGYVLMDSLALCLLLYKSVLHTREMKNIGFEQVSLLTVMAQDGMAYFVFNIVCAVANSIILERSTSDYRYFLVSTQCCVQNVLCARLFFHMQTARRIGMGLTTMSKMPSDIRFNGNADLEMDLKARRRTGADDLYATTWTAGLTVSYLDDEDVF
ncbi:hypothetical protein SCHPADRAFT_926972 [Schizopora paradoxa]|uniref:DUF6533 domain-containing protein n=1 Tax=Schizopora paradoxa TaxID=27342 RepID=A0A0H2S224_9AGAM|nr:hypothetical protein SCHPADRAFT_926972 [Schizopora paradoxa]